MSRVHLVDPYVAGVSFLHTSDPRLKLLGALAFVAAVTVLPRGSGAALVAMLCLAGLAIAASRLPLRAVLIRAAPAFTFATLVALGSLIVEPRLGQPSVRILWLSVSTDRVDLVRFVDILARAGLSALVLGLYLAVTRFGATVRAMGAMGMPAPLTGAVAFTYRYLFVLVDEVLRLDRARQARTLQRPGLRHLSRDARVTGGMVGSLFLRAYSRSERVYQAMLSRGYHGEVRGLGTLAWSRRDTTLLALWTTSLLIIAVAGIML